MFYINGTAVSPNMQETNQATPHKWLRQKPENKLFFNKVKALEDIEEDGNLHNSDIICSIPFINIGDLYHKNLKMRAFSF